MFELVFCAYANFDLCHVFGVIQRVIIIIIKAAPVFARVIIIVKGNIIDCSINLYAKN